MKGAGLTRKLGIHLPRRLRELARRGPAPEAVPQELPPASLTDRQERRRSRAAAHRLVTAGAHP